MAEYDGLLSVLTVTAASFCLENGAVTVMSFSRANVIILLLLLAFTAPVFGQGKTDVIVMKNGDRMTCEIKSLDGGVLHVKLDYIDGTVAVDWSKVARIESNQLFVIRTERGSVYTGKLNTVDAVGAEPVKIEVAVAAGNKVEVERSDVVTIEPTHNRVWRRFSGEISAGATYSKGNQSTQYNLHTSLDYTADRWAAGADYNSTLSSNSSSSTTERNQFTGNVKHLMPWKNYFYAGSVGFLQSSEQGIDLQTTIGGGLGRYFKNTNRTKLSGTAGLAFQRTKYSDSTTGLTASENQAAVLLAADFRFFRFKKTNLQLSTTLLPSISEPGRYYFKVNQKFYVKLYKDITWNLSFYGSWDNRPPNGLPGSDYGTSTGLGWSFGDK